MKIYLFQKTKIIEDFICRKKITEGIEFLLILTDNMSILLLEVPLCYVNLQLQTIGGSSTKLSGIYQKLEIINLGYVRKNG